jgi:hypothetical protein
MITTKRSDLPNQLLSPRAVAFDEYGQFWAGKTNGKQGVKLFDDFLGDVLQDPWRGAAGTAGTVPTILASGTNGRVRLAMGNDAGASMAANGSQLDAGNLNFLPSQGGLILEAHLTLDVVTDVAVFVGFTDQISALEMPWTLSGTTFTSNQTDGCGFLFDTAATTDTIRCVGVDSDVDAATQDTSLAFAAGVSRVFRLEVTAAGAANFWIDGKQFSTMSAATTPSVKLSPVVACFSRTTTARLLDVDYIMVLSERN